jgi:hypothetical protein
LLKYWINKLFGRPAVRFSGPGNAIIYSEHGHKISIFGEMMPDGFAMDLGSIVSWDDKPGEVVDEAERARIADAARAVWYLNGART